MGGNETLFLYIFWQQTTEGGELFFLFCYKKIEKLIFEASFQPKRISRKTSKFSEIWNQLTSSKKIKLSWFSWKRCFFDFCKRLEFVCFFVFLFTIFCVILTSEVRSIFCLFFLKRYATSFFFKELPKNVQKQSFVSAHIYEEFLFSQAISVGFFFETNSVAPFFFNSFSSFWTCKFDQFLILF